MTELKTFLHQLAPISQTSWNVISTLFTLKYLKKGDYFIEEGQTAKEIAFLKSGVVRGFYRNIEGKEYNKHFFANPCFIGGYSSLITQNPSNISQQALTNCTILSADYQQIQNLFNTHSNIERLARILAEMLFIQKEQREIELVLLNAEERYKRFQKEFPDLEQQIAQYHIASYLGITPTQLSRIRKNISGK